jgi:hypothetical protein
MIKFFFLLPMLTCGIWYLYIKSKGFTVKQCKTSFSYILIFNVVIIAFFTLMVFITDNP